MSRDLIKLTLQQLRPTQFAVGYEAVEEKRQVWRARTIDQQTDFILSHPFPVVRGPGKDYFVIDGHHLGVALLQEGVDLVWARLIADFSQIEEPEFFRIMHERGFLCPSSEKNFHALPKTLRDLADDPFRSLVAHMRRACGCPKDRSPFAEFRWAHFLRERISTEMLRDYPDAALAASKRLVREAFCQSKSGHCRCMEPA